MAVTAIILRAFFMAVVMTVAMTGVIAEYILQQKRLKQQQEAPGGFQEEAVAQRVGPNRWTKRIAGGSLVVAFVLLGLFVARVPSLAYADGKWVAGPWDNWYVPFMGALSLAVLALFVDRLSRFGQLGRSVALVLAVSLLYAGLFFLRVRV